MYIRLNGTSYSNNSNILITDIGQGNGGALCCITDLAECCKMGQTTITKALGDWFSPNGEVVGLNKTNQTLYKNRDHSKVCLHRKIDSISPVGKFCCEVPDATYTNITVCVNLGE